MEKKELVSMKKHRGLFLAMGLAALMGLVASEARAETLNLTVYAGSGTTGTVIYTETGGVTAAQFSASALTTALGGAGFSAYTFSNIGASSNNPGSATNAFINTSGVMTVGSGTGADTPITVVVSETGFMAPGSISGNTLNGFVTANFLNDTTSSASQNGTFADSSSPAVTAATGPLNLTTSGSGAPTSATLGAYVTPFTLTTESVISVSPASSTTTGTFSFTNKVFVTSTGVIPEPASIVMMLTGMPLPLVMMGLLRRRRAA
jgi:hypothetical protein